MIWMGQIIIWGMEPENGADGSKSDDFGTTLAVGSENGPEGLNWAILKPLWVWGREVAQMGPNRFFFEIISGLGRKVFQMEPNHCFGAVVGVVQENGPDGTISDHFKAIVIWFVRVLRCAHACTCARACDPVLFRHAVLRARVSFFFPIAIVFEHRCL